MLRQYSIFLLLLVLLIPTAFAEEEYWEYTFRPGDSIWNIAKKYTTSANNWVEIQKINQIRQGHDRKIRPGTRIVIPVSMLKLQPTAAHIVALNGNITVTRANGEKETLTTQTKLYSGDRIQTTNQQSLRLQFADQSEFQILPSSEIVLDKISLHKSTGMVDTRVRLNAGSINTQVKKQGSNSIYQIKTPSAITSVRGTSFRLSTDADHTSRTEVTGGIVTVSAGSSEKNVKDGYGIIAEKGKPLPEPIKLLAAPIININQPPDMTQVFISWPMQKGAVVYRYQLANDKKFNHIFHDVSSTNTSIMMNALAPGNYFLRVRAIDQYKLEGLDSVKQFAIYQAPPPPLPPPIEDESYWEVILPFGAFILFL